MWTQRTEHKTLLFAYCAMRSLPHHRAEELTEFVQVAGASSNPGPYQDQQVSLCEICVKGVDLTEFRKLPFCFFSKAVKSY